MAVSGVVSGSGNLAISGAGTFNFSAANSYTGSTTLATPGANLILSGANGSLQTTSAITLNGGSSLTLDSTVANHGTLDRIADALPIAASGATINLIGNASAPTTETVGTLNLGSGITNVNVTPGAGQTATLTFGSPTIPSFNRTVVGSAVNFSSTGTIAAPNVTLDGGGLIGGWATIGNMNSSAPTNVLDFATVVGGNVVPVSNYTNTNTLADFVPGANVKMNGGTVAAPTVVALSAASTTINSLYLSGASQLLFGTASPGTSQSPNTLIITSGAIISNAATGSWGINNQPTITAAASIGSLFNGDNSNGQNYQGIITSGNGKDLIIDAASNLRINSIIANNGTTPIGLTKNGTGVLDLSDGNKQDQPSNGAPGVTEIANTYTGITTINAGTILVNEDQNFGAVPATFTANSITLNGGILLTTRGFNFAANRGITVGPQGGTLAYEGGATWTIAQKITGPGSIIFSSQPLGFGGTNQTGGNLANTLVLNSPNGTNNYQGATTLNTDKSGGTPAIRWGVAEQIPNNSAVTVTGAAGLGGINMNNLAETIGSLASAPGIGVITNLGAFTTGQNGLSTSYGGTIAGGGSFTKVGGGTQALGGINTYTGPTNINGGTLLIGSGTATTSTASLGTGAVTVGNSSLTGALGGNGTINGPVTVTSTGHLAPAMTPSTTNTLTINNSLTVNNGATLDFNFGAPGTNDVILRDCRWDTDDRRRPSGPITLNVTALPGLAKGAYKLFDSSANPSGFSNTATFAINGTTNFNYAVVSSGANFDAAVGGGTVPLGDIYLEVLPGNPALTWVGNTNGNWNTTTPNWTSVSAGNVYAEGSNVTFDDTATGTTTIAVASPVSPSSMVLSNATLNYTFNGAAINVTANAGITKNQGGAVVFNTNVSSVQTGISGGSITVGPGKTFTSTTKVNVTGGQMIVNGTLNTPTLTIGPSGGLTVGAAGALSPAPALTVNGTATFNNPSQSVASLVGNGSITLNSTALNLSTDTNFLGPIAGSGTVNVSAGTVTLAGANSFHGGVVSGGSLVLPTAGTTSGTFETQVGTSITAATGALGTSTVKLNGGSLTLNGGTGSIVGLVGNYYNNTPANVNNSDPDYASLATLTAHLSGLTAALIAPTTTGGSLGLDFSNANFGAAAPFASQGFATITNIEALFAGKFNVTNPGPYTFTTRSDDGSVLFIDGNMVVSNNFYQGATSRSGTVSLGAGLHDISIGYYQGTGGSGFLVQVTDPTGLNPNQTIQNTALFNGVASANYGNNVQLVVDGLIDVPNALSAAMGTLTMASSTNLTTTNGTVVFTGTTLTGSGPFGFSPTTFDIATGPIASTGAVSITKSGAGALMLRQYDVSRIYGCRFHDRCHRWKSRGRRAGRRQQPARKRLGNVRERHPRPPSEQQRRQRDVRCIRDIQQRWRGLRAEVRQRSGRGGNGDLWRNARHHDGRMDDPQGGRLRWLYARACRKPQRRWRRERGGWDGEHDRHGQCRWQPYYQPGRHAECVRFAQQRHKPRGQWHDQPHQRFPNGGYAQRQRHRRGGPQRKRNHGHGSQRYRRRGLQRHLTGIGAVTKSGNGSLTLSNGLSTYSGGTTVTGGALIATNTTGSATGPGPVLVQSAGTNRWYRHNRRTGDSQRHAHARRRWTRQPNHWDHYVWEQSHGQRRRQL